MAGREKRISKFSDLYVCLLSDHCPWCTKEGVIVHARKKSILRRCLHKCGYEAHIPKKLLPCNERIRYYDPKRYRREPFRWSNPDDHGIVAILPKRTVIKPPSQHGPLTIKHK